MSTKKRTGIMLAYPFEEKRLTNFPYLIQPKLDGERCRVPEINGMPTLLSSTEELITGVPHIAEVMEFVKDHDVELPELDGELYCHEKSFDEIHSIVSRQYESTRHPDFKDVHYYIFDVITADLQIVRTTYLESTIEGIFRDCPYVHIVPSYVAQSMEDIYYYYNLFIEMGYEGIIVRDKVSPYVRRRSTKMLKFKEKRRDDYEIVEIVEAVSKTGDLLGMLGSVRCTKDGEAFSVGAGQLTHDHRRYYLQHKDQYIGGNCEVGYQNLTKERGVPRSGMCITIKLGRTNDEQAIT